MTDLLEFSPKAIIAMGVKRIQPLVDKHGITSPEVLAACVRWGGMLDEVNYPDSPCRWCGTAVFHSGEGTYCHTETQSRYCWKGAPAVAKPLMNDAEREQATVRLTPSGAINKKLPRKDQMSLSGRTLPNQMTPRDWPF